METMVEHTAKQLIYVTGSGRSGSTLLDMLLTRHSQIAALGEVHRLYLNANREESRAHHCTCGMSVLQCPFWREVERELVSLYDGAWNFKTLITTNPAYLQVADDVSGSNIVEPVPQKLWELGLPQLLSVFGSKRLFSLCSKIFPSVGLQRRIAQNSHLLYEAVRRSTGKSIVVDSTKTPMRLKTLYMTSPVPFKVIYLVRDGRSVTAARMRRQGVTMEVAARIWKSEHRKIRLVLHSLPRGVVSLARYESICENPRELFQNLSEFLGVAFEPEMVSLKKELSHSLGGNPMRWKKNENEIILDDRWRSELTLRDLKTFESIAGSLNRRLGYIE